MASNRPLFDDEDLPAWLKNAGITYAGQSGAMPLSGAEESSSAADLSWLDDAQTGAAASSAPWGQEATPAAPGAAELPPWLASATPATPAASSGAESAPWMQDAAPGETQPDTELPPWMQMAPPTNTTPAANAELPSWLTSAGSAEPAAPAASDDLPPWAQQTPADRQSADDWQTPAAPTPGVPPTGAGVTGMLPWRQGVSETPGMSEENPFADAAAPWEASEPAAQPEQPSSGDLPPWAQETAPEPSQEVPAPETPVAAVEDLDWLDQALETLSPESEPVVPPPAPPEPPRPTIKRLTSTQPVVPPQPPAEDQTPPAPPEPPRPTIKRLTSTQPAVPPQPAQDQTPPAAEPPRAPIRRLPSPQPMPTPQDQTPPAPIKRLPSAQPDQPDLSEMTYEEWEQSQIQKEAEAQITPEDRLLDEVPDWFAGASQEPPPQLPQAQAPSGAEFMPEWFVGMEEQPSDAAPDWFANMDLSSTPLVGPETVQAPVPPTAPTEAAPAVSADDVPDWFTGSVAGADELDFNAMFVSPTPEPEKSPEPPPPVAPPPTEMMPEEALTLPTETIQAEAPMPPVEIREEAAPPEPAEPDLDWMSDLPPLESMLETPSQPEAQEPPSRDQAEIPSGWFEEPEQPEQPELTESGDLLDWLSESPRVDSAQPEPAAGESDNWMTSLTSELAASASSPAPELEESDTPDWMRDIAPVGATPGAAEMEIQPPAPSEELDWLSDFAALAPEEQQARSETPAEAPVEMTPTPAETPAEAPVPAFSDMDIDSLLNLSASAVRPAESQEVELPIPESAELDIDLDQVIIPPINEEPSAAIFDAPAWTPPPAPAPTPVQAAPAEPAAVEEPAPAAPPSSGRLRRIAPVETPVPVEEPAPPPEPEPEAQEPMPEWVSDLKPVEGPVTLRIGDQEVRLQDQPLVQVPNSLRRVRERSRTVAEALSALSPAAPQEDAAGPLAGVTDAIQAATDAIQPRIVIGSGARTTADLYGQRIRIIENMLGLEEAARRKALTDSDVEEKKPVAAARPAVKVDRYIVTLLLALTVIAPFFTGALNAVSQPDTSHFPPTVQSVASAIDAIPPQQSTLVVFEYGPTGAGELDDLARPILRSLIKHGALPIIVSTYPAGAIHAQQLLAQMAASPSELSMMGRAADNFLVARKDYVVLPYLPGGVTGIRWMLDATLHGTFMQLADQTLFQYDIEGKPTGLPEVMRGQVAQNPTFILTETADDVRNWVEQWNDPVAKLKIVLLSSASASAVAQTYATSDKRILGLLVSLRDATIFQAQQQQVGDAKTQTLAAQRWQSIGLASLVAALLILAGTIINAMRSFRRRERH